MRNAAPGCTCKNGYYEKDSYKCLPCKKPCATCSTEKICTTFDCSNSMSGMYLSHPSNENTYEPTGCNLLTEEE